MKHKLKTIITGLALFGTTVAFMGCSSTSGAPSANTVGQTNGNNAASVTQNKSAVDTVTKSS